MIKVGTIHKIHKQLVENGYDVSEYRLRIWVKQKILPAVFLGSKVLISYQRVLDILDPSVPQPGYAATE